MVKNILANFAGRGIGVLLSLICIPLYIHYLGIEGYAQIGIFYTLMAVINMFCLGLGSVITREMARNKESFELLGMFEIIYCALGCLIILYFGATFESIVIAFQLLYCIYESALMGMQKQVQANVLNAIFAVLRALGAFSPTLNVFFIWLTVVTFLQAVVFRCFIYKTFPKWNFQLLKQYKTLILESSGNSFLGQILTQIDKVVLSRMLSLEAFGYYCVASSVCNSISHVVIPVIQSFYPAFSEYFALRQRVDMAYKFGMKIICFLILPIGTVLCFFSKQILLLWTQNPVIAEHTYKIVTLLAIAKTLEGIVQLPWSMTFAFGWRTGILYQQFVSLIIMVPAMIWGTIHFGTLGACVVLIVVNLGYLLIGVPMIHKRIFV